MKKKISLSAQLYIVALLLRLIPVVLSYDLAIGLDDMFQYDMLARNIAGGNGFRWYGEAELALYQQYFPFEFVLPEGYHPAGVLTSFRAPAYPAFLAIIYFFSSSTRRWFYARIVQAFIGASLAPLTFQLAKIVFPESLKTQKISGAILALYPMLLVYPIGLATENLFFPLFLATTLALLYAAKHKHYGFYILSGILFGLTALTRSAVISALPFIMLWLWFDRKHKKAVFIFPVFVALVIAPWSIRNTMLHNKFTFIETSLGYNLHMGYHPQSTGTFTFGVSLELLPYIDDMEREEIGNALALGYITADPGRVPELIVRKLGHFFALEIRPLVYFYSSNFFGAVPSGALISIFLLFGLPFVFLSSFAMVGIVTTRWNQPARLVGLIALTYTLPHLLIMAEPRFHLVLIPYFAVFAAQGWTQRKKIFSLHLWKKALLIGLISLLFLNWGLALWHDADKLAMLFGSDGNLSYFDY